MLKTNHFHFADDLYSKKPKKYVNFKLYFKNKEKLFI